MLAHPDVEDVAANAYRARVLDRHRGWLQRIGLFQGPSDEAAAEGRFVHVYVDNTDPARSVTPMPDVIRAAVEPLLRER